MEKYKPAVPQHTASILIVGDDFLARRGVRSLLEEQPGWMVVSEARNEEAVARARDLQPDIVVLDTGIQQNNGIKAIDSIVHSNPGLKLVVLDDPIGHSIVQRALRAGALGYVRKKDAEADLVPAVISLLEGRLFFPGNVVQHLAFVQTGGTDASRDPSLSQRETTILELITLGKKNKEIAQQFRISERTVEDHRGQIRHKLGVATLTDLVRYAIRNGIIQP
jgi:DNA-binding NarL/FixJ family response regulator